MSEIPSSKGRVGIIRVRCLVPGMFPEQYSYGSRGKRANHRMGHGVRMHTPGRCFCHNEVHGNDGDLRVAAITLTFPAVHVDGKVKYLNTAAAAPVPGILANRIQRTGEILRIKELASKLFKNLIKPPSNL